MERGATIGQAKARRMSETAVLKKSETKKKSPRNPFKGCNIGSIAPLQASVEAQRRGCFRFLLHNSSSKGHSVPKSKLHPRTPKSAPPNFRAVSSKAIAYPSSIRNRNPPSPISENPLKRGSKMPVKPKTTPDLLHGWNQRKPKLRELSRGKGKTGSSMSSTQERRITIVDLKPCSLGKEGRQRLTSTPTSNSTPPIQASISPEVPSSSATPRPVCYATGHLIAGVKDHRKCRPRGVLTIGQKRSKCFQVLSPPSSLAGASICWLSSSLDIPNGTTQGSSSSKFRSVGFPDEASVSWLLSPSDAGEEELEEVLVKKKSTNLDAMLRIETTPSSGTGILQTPTSSGSTSPFSVIVQKAEASPFSENSWSKVNDISTPSSYSNSRRNGVISPLEIDSAKERFKALRMSPNKNAASPLPSLSFKFGCSPTPLSSIDLNCFKSSRAVSKAEVEGKNSTVSSTRISWREGLLSRIFEIGELDSYQCFFDDEEANFDCPTGEVKSESSFKFDSEIGSSVLKEGTGFGSFELLIYNNEFGVQKCESKLPPSEPNSVAESISTEVGGLISSCESDWTQFYRNNLFEL